MDDQAETCTEVYDYVWRHIVQYHTPPDPRTVAADLGLKAWEMRYVLDELRRTGRIEYGKALMPTAWRVWCRNNPAPAPRLSGEAS